MANTTPGNAYPVADTAVSRFRKGCFLYDTVRTIAAASVTTQTAAARDTNTELIALLSERLGQILQVPAK